MAEKQIELQKMMMCAAPHPTPFLKPERLHAFVEYYFNRRDHYLKIVEKQSVPLYLLETFVLRDKAQQFKNAFQKILPSVGFYYAVKSNHHPNIAQTLLDSGFGLDVSSGLELDMALNLGAKDIVFSGPGKTSTELRMAADNAPRVTVLIDSYGELRRLAGIAAGLKAHIRCGVRLTVDPKGLWRKFGIPLQAFPNFWQEATGYPFIQLVGLQFHSSWNLTPDTPIEFIRSLGNKLADMPASYKKNLEFIDIGGGYWPEQGEWLQASGTPEGKLRECFGQQTEKADTHYCLPTVTIEEYATQIGAAIHENIFPVVQCRICFEPGRWICNDAVHLLMSVVDKKEPDLVITDAGTNAVGWERFEVDYFPILNLTKPSMIEKPCEILGSLCTPHDVWGYMYFGEEIEEGDILMIPTQGAYTYSLRQNFIKPLPPVHIT